MDDYTAKMSAAAADASGPCTKPFLLCELMEGKDDKLGHIVEEILWIGQNYAIYRSQKGVYVQFSNVLQEAAEQRCRFTEISPELCELRYLTNEMRSGWNPTRRHPSYLYDHNIAQAVMLVMENKVAAGQQLAQQALKMAVQRVTNDNTIRYFACCVGFWIVSIVISAAVGALARYGVHSQELFIYAVAAISGATGAVLSVAARLQSFQLRPCHQSGMNYLMSMTRVGIGLIAGPILLLLALTVLHAQIKTIVPMMADWPGAAVLGLVAGFAERLIPNLLGRTADQIESPAGTPVQAVRNNAPQADAVRPQ
jgi:hypothetical protein